MKQKTKNYEILPNGKKALSKEVIDREISGQKTPVLVYVLLVIFTLIPPFALLTVPMLIKGMRTDTRIKNMKYYILEQPCIKKDCKYDIEYPDEYYLVFYNPKRKGNFTLDVPEAIYKETEAGDAFYFVFAEKEKEPLLHYRKSEFEIIAESFNGMELLLPDRESVSD